MKDRYEAVMNFISEAEIALAKARAEIAFERLDKAMEPPTTIQNIRIDGAFCANKRILAEQAANIISNVAPDPDMTDDPPSRPA